MAPLDQILNAWFRRRMQNAIKAQRDNGATPTRLTLKKTLGPSVIHSVHGAQCRAPNLPDSPPTDLHGPNLPTAPSDQCWTAKLSYLKPLLRFRRTFNFFCNFHSGSTCPCAFASDFLIPLFDQISYI